MKVAKPDTRYTMRLKPLASNWLDSHLYAMDNSIALQPVARTIACVG